MRLVWHLQLVGQWYCIGLLTIGSQVRTRLVTRFENLFIVRNLLFPLLKNPKPVIDEQGHRLHIFHVCPHSLCDTFIRAKVKTPKTSPSSPPKITRCNDSQCKTCKFIAHNTTSHTFHNTGQTRTTLSCPSDNLVYMINCK